MYATQNVARTFTCWPIIVCVLPLPEKNDHHKEIWWENILTYQIYGPNWTITTNICQRITQKLLSLSKFNSVSMTTINSEYEHNT